MDEKSGVILTGYCAEGTVAAKIKNNPASFYNFGNNFFIMSFIGQQK